METCRPLTTPTPQDIQRERRSFVNKARSLLVLLGLDPTPANVAKIQQDPNTPDVLIVNNKEYEVLDNEETLDKLELLMLQYPKRLPPKFLALFLTGAFKDPTLDFRVVEVVAEALRAQDTLDSNWALHKLIDYDNFKHQHLQEVIDQSGLDGLFYGYKVHQTQFLNSNYVILEKMELINECQ